MNTGPGLNTRHKSYSRATVTSELIVKMNHMINWTSKLPPSLTMKWGSNYQTQMFQYATHSQERRTLQIKWSNLTHRKVKNRILKRAKYKCILTAKYREIAATARKLRKEQKIVNTWTRNCQIFIRLSNENGNSNVKMIKEMKDFSDLNLL